MDHALHVAGNVFEDGPRKKIRAPWDGAELGEVVLADAERVDLAIDAAVKAFAATRRTSTGVRKRALRFIAETIGQNAQEIAATLADESGKPIALARAEVARAVATFDLAAEEATRLGGEVLDLDATPPGEGYHGMVRRVPSGPVIAIAPFNFPLNLVAHKVAPALACGASIVLKPPPQTPLSALHLAAIVREAGLPPNALQVVPCEVAEAERMVKDPRFAVFSFTGSDRVGWHLKDVAGKKRALLELGGNAAAIVHEDGDVAFAAERVVFGAFGYAGQVCIKVQRLIVHDAIHDAFVADVLERTRALAVKSPREPGILSCMIDEANAVRVDAWIDEAIAGGARPLLRGVREGNRLGPTILAIDGTGAGMKVVEEEAFGPVLTIQRYESWADALAIADATRYGLQAGIFTDSEARIAAAYDALHVGGIVVEDVPTFRVDGMPYGGARDSGLGREGVRYAIEEMTERKLLVKRRKRG